ncbi:Methylated-DNA-protein-cysteine methyltransferase [Phytophthora megakarya]|uniref:Methylated-DNA--protein-cysteine methyltransferase n=1 Tax=Phytophthora megakarya TaxID=4795 RepID=A0A225WHA1_9STRA|nr:Methylated-DNA-protein-cysteine methyltransferase [Phytophthora megakarya]
MTVRNSKTKKTRTKTTQNRKPGITMKSKTKPTQHIMWRGKQITKFESRVYELISTIPAGKVSTYGGVAEALHSGPRCVGQALRKNPFAPEVPCHRVVAATLDIGGFQGATGEESPLIQKKRALLATEGVCFTKDHKVRCCVVHCLEKLAAANITGMLSVE